MRLLPKSPGSREVGTEGKLGGQAEVPEVAGTWKDLTDNVNFMASNNGASAQYRRSCDRYRQRRSLQEDYGGRPRRNAFAQRDAQYDGGAAAFLRRRSHAGSARGWHRWTVGQAVVPGVGGTWKDLTDNVNLLAANLTTQVRNIAEVTTAVAGGDLSRKITVDVKGEILD